VIPSFFVSSGFPFEPVAAAFFPGASSTHGLLATASAVRPKLTQPDLPSKPAAKPSDGEY
jgi:hypothetical protein